MAKQSEGKAVKQSNAPTGVDKKKTRTTIILAAVVAIVVGVTAGIAIYRDRVAPFNTVIVEVNGTEIDMRYFLKRLVVSGEESMALLSTLTKEEIIKQKAPEPPYNIAVTEEDIDNFAKDVARGEAETIEEAEFREWYRQQLNDSGFSNIEYRELLKSAFLQSRMQEYLSERIPPVAEQVFINLIIVGQDIDLGREIKAKFDAGEDFAALARKHSTDPQLKENGGKFGWFPEGALEPVLGNTAFELEVGKCSDPFYFDEENVVLLMVSERVPTREIDDQSMELLKSKVLEKWFNDEFQNNEVKFTGFTKGRGYDSQTDAWVNWQLWRMKRGEQQEEEDSSAESAEQLSTQQSNRP